MIILVSLLLFSCNQSVNQNQEAVKSAPADSNIILASTMDVFNTIPSPVDAAELLNKAGVKFEEKILNPVKNVPYYETSQSMALNLGIYCADLSFTSFYDQKQVTIDYLSAVKTLADGLGIIDLVNQNDIIKLEDNLYNKDSIKIYVKDIFFNSGKILNDNNRPEIALMVQVGGWVEGIYLAMQLAKQSGTINKELVDRVSEQRNSLLLVIKSLENFSKINQIQPVIDDMNRLKQIYDKMVAPPDSNQSNATVLNSDKNRNLTITPEIFLSLYHEINKIRNSYTQ
ncbi:MAG: hypothetical protein U0W24_03785 [Bacteroidales bacterium]